MMQIEINYGSVSQSMGERSMFDTDMYIVNPAETGWQIGRTMMTRWPNAYEGLFVSSKHRIHSVNYTTKCPLKSV